MTDGGLLRFRDGTFEPIDLPSATVRALHEARDGTLWVAMDRGVARLRDGRLVGVSPTLAGIYAYAFHEDPDGSVWLGTSNGLYVHEDGEYSAAGEPLGLGRHAVHAIWRGSDQVLHVGTAGGGLYRVRGTRAERVRGEDGPIWSVLEDRRGTVWVAGDHRLQSLQAHGLERSFAEHGLAGLILSLFEDREGSLWVGTRYAGLVRLAVGRATSIGHELAHPSVLTVLEDRAGQLWFGMAGGGLGRLHGGRVESYGPQDGLTSDIIGPVLEDRERRIWFGPRAGDKLLRLPLVGGTGVRLQASRRGEPFAIPEDARHAIFHVGQEPVTNALRHGHARKVDILVSFERQGVRLVIEDDGRGFEPAAVDKDHTVGLGLLGMADRVTARHDGARIVAMTSFGGDAEMRRALEAGALGLLLKGASGDEVVEAVRRVHAGRPHIGADVAEELRAGSDSPALTRRESDVLTLMAEGLRNQEIAATLGLSLGTVKVHVNRILEKLDAVDRTEAVTRALKRGLIVLQ